MKKLLSYMILFLTGLSQGLFGQVLEPLNSGLEHPSFASVTVGSKMQTLTTDDNGYLRVAIWDGDQWQYSVSATSQPIPGKTTDSEVKVKSFVAKDQASFILLSVKNKDNTVIAHHVIKYENAQWTDISDINIQEAEDISELLVFNNKLVAIGKSLKDTPSNIFYLENDVWTKKGNYITPDIYRDYILDAEVYFDKIYVTGVFTKIGSSDKRYIAEWNGDQWQFMSFPPFVQQAYTFGKYNDKLVLFGKPISGYQAIRIYDRSSWQDLSNGLEAVNINSLNSFAWNKDMLWATGNFTNTSSSKTSSLMYYLPSSGWMVADDAILNSTLKLSQWGDKVLLNGDFNTYYHQSLNHIAEISAFTAVLRGMVYNDADGNCLYNPTETPESGISLVLNPGNYHFVSNSDGSFNLPVLPGNYTLKAIAPKNWESTCDVIEVNVEERNTVADIHLPIKPIANRADITLDMHDYTGWKVGVDVPNQYRICARNVGTTSIVSGKLIFFLPQEMENFTFSPLPDYLDLQKAEWNLSNILVKGEYCVDIVASLKSGISTGKVVKLNTQVEINGGVEIDDTDNDLQMEQITGENLTSNSKSSSIKGTFNSDYEPLHYRISFQNQIGTKLNKLKITDTLDDDIYLSAKGIYESTSHPSTLQHSYHLLPGGNYQYVLNWTFDNIDLPDSAVDFAKSMGYADIKVYTDMRYMKKGATICNKAYLYFDNNEPLITNAVCNDISNVGISSSELGSLHVYPNPASNILMVDGISGQRGFTIFSVIGETLSQGELHDGSNTISLKNLSPGFYFLYIKELGSMKFVVE